jgi:hypothetical protein
MKLGHFGPKNASGPKAIMSAPAIDGLPEAAIVSDRRPSETGQCQQDTD